ncbi:MAG: hypothetical protein ACYTFM_06730 [Planctomycetota bacterium]|jgi:hypothetical protein
MNRVQKIAWFTLVMQALALVLSLTAVGVFYFGFDWPLRRAAGGFGFIGIMGFSALAPLIFKKGKDDMKPDERDLLIKRKAMLAAYWSFWPLFVLAAMAPLYVLGPNGKVGVRYLVWMVFGGMFYVMLIQAIATLQEYGWREKGGES